MSFDQVWTNLNRGVWKTRWFRKKDPWRNWLIARLLTFLHSSSSSNISSSSPLSKASSPLSASQRREAFVSTKRECWRRHRGICSSLLNAKYGYRVLFPPVSQWELLQSDDLSAFTQQTFTQSQHRSADFSTANNKTDLISLMLANHDPTEGQIQVIYLCCWREEQ